MYRTTILLAMVFLGLGVYVYTIEVPTMELETLEQEASQRLLPFDYRDVTELTITTPDETIRLSRDDRHRWMIHEPVQDKGDSRAVRNLLRALEIGKVSRVIQEDGKGPSHYGLDPPKLTIHLSTPNQSETLLLGDVAPLTSTLYVQRQSDNHILLTTLGVSDFRRKNVFTFRYKNVMFFNRASVDRIQLQSPWQQMTLHRVASVHGPTDNWRFSAPFEGPADTTSVNLLLMALEDLTATAFIDSQSDKEALLKQFANPLLTATLHTPTRGHVVSIYQSPRNPDEVFAITSANHPIYRISSSILSQLPQQAFDLQDRRLFGMEMADIGLLAVKTPDANFTVVQQFGEWYWEDDPERPMNQEEMTLFVSRVVNLPAEILISMTPNNLAEYGLDPPMISIQALDRKGRPRGRLLLGKRERGLVYAMGQGLPGIYQARSLILTQIPKGEWVPTN